MAVRSSQSASLIRALLAAIVVASLAGCSKKEDEEFVSEVEEIEEALPREFPAEMAEFRDEFEASRLEFATATAVAAATSIRDSKLLGTPYLPAGVPYPMDVDGEPLQLLAQINFADLPPLQDFPGEGILQFYISPVESREQVYGLQLYDPRHFDETVFLETLQLQQYFRVMYFPEVYADDANLEPELPPVATGFLPVNNEARLSFKAESGYVTTEDYRFEEVFGTDPYEFFDYFGQAADLVWEQYHYFVDQYSIARVGGYASFTQEDPRVLAPEEDWVLLFQLDSFTTEDGVEVLWGDAGIGSFHIRREDLLKQDFSRVLYIWDSH